MTTTTEPTHDLAVLRRIAAEQGWRIEKPGDFDKNWWCFGQRGTQGVEGRSGSSEEEAILRKITIDAPALRAQLPPALRGDALAPDAGSPVVDPVAGGPGEPGRGLGEEAPPLIGAGKTAYVCGPMRSLPRFNFPAFDSAAEVLRTQGYTVISPAEIDREMGFNPDTDQPTPAFMQAAIERDCAAIMKADVVVLLDGWQNSSGARAEIELARWRGIPVLDWSTMEPPEDVPITDEARGLVFGDRRHAYGSPFDDFTRVVGAFAALTGIGMTPAQGAMFLMVVKMARECHRPKRDNRVDMAGYAEVIDLIQNKMDEIT